LIDNQSTVPRQDIEKFRKTTLRKASKLYHGGQ
jgi:hypothetical protein